MAEQRFCKPQVLGSNPSGGYQERGFPAAHVNNMKSAAKADAISVEVRILRATIARLDDGWPTPQPVAVAV